MSIERRIQCPSCAREIRLTEAELADKRGFCALCDARFDILPDMLVGSGPMRALAVPRVVLNLNEPPGQSLERVASGADTDLVIRAPRGNAAVVGFLGGLTGLIAFVSLWTAEIDVPMVFWAILATFGAGVLLGILWCLFGEERLAVRPGGVLHSRGLGPLRRETRLPGSHHLRVDTLALPANSHYPLSHRVSIRGEEGEILYGKLLGLDEQQADWVALAVRKALADAKGEG
jgi:hypothetical protein